VAKLVWDIASIWFPIVFPLRLPIILDAGLRTPRAASFFFLVVGKRHDGNRATDSRGRIYAVQQKDIVQRTKIP
jgi:hypothetical protein